jgi:hypothetical protein
MVANVNFDKNIVGTPVLDSAGDTVTYEFVLEHQGGEDITSLALTDTLLGLDIDLLAEISAGNVVLDGDDGDFVLQAGETWTFTEAATSDIFTYTLTQEDLDSGGTAEPLSGFINFPGVIDNLATLTTNASFSIETEAAELTLSPAISILKETNGTDGECPDVLVGSTVTWTYTVTTGEGNVALSNVVVSDDNGTPLNPDDDFNPDFVGGDTDGDGKLDVGETWTYTATAAALAGEYVNVATADGAFVVDLDPPFADVNTPVSDSEEDCYTGLESNIFIVKTTNGTDDFCPEVEVGSTVTWGYTVTTTGDVSIENVVVVDDAGTPGDTIDDFNPTFVGGDTSGDGVLDVGETWTYTFDGVAQLGEYANIATVNGTAADEFGNTATVSDSEDDCYTGVEPPPPGPGQGATPGFWKNHPDIANEELSEFQPGLSLSSFYESVFGVEVPGNPTLADALAAGGGGVNALERHSTAAFIASAVNEGADPDGEEGLNFSFSAATSSDPDIIAILNQMDLNDDSTLQPNEVINAVQDVLNDSDATTDFFGLAGQPGIEDVKNAFEAMNEQPHPGIDAF